jgi:hypothetical protein
MKTFKDLEFTDFSDSFGEIRARITFDNGYGASVIRTQRSDGRRLELFELAILDSNGGKCRTTPLTDDVIGYLRDIDVTEVMRKVQQLPPIKKTSTKGPFYRLKWIIDYYIVYFLYNNRKIHRYHQYMSDKYGNRYVDLFNNREGKSQ